MVLFHATKKRFRKFNLKYVGTGQGERQFGYGFYLTSSRTVANYYAKEINGFTIEVRLEAAKIVNGYNTISKKYLKKIKQILLKRDYQLSQSELDSFSYGGVQMLMEETFNEKIASEIFMEAGIDGMTYTPMIKGEVVEGGKDYVVFNAKKIIKNKFGTLKKKY